MTRYSIRFRLLVSTVISVVMSLLVAGFGIVTLFENHVERRIKSELETYLNQITAGFVSTIDDQIEFNRRLADVRFDQPLSGLYWQIQDETLQTMVRSRSLWDFVIELPKDELKLGSVHDHELEGPNGQVLLVRERQIIASPNKKDHRLRLAVAIDRRNLVESRESFKSDLVPYLLLLASILFFAGWLQVRVGLNPLDGIRRGVMAIRTGGKQRLQERYPDEVNPLVEEINELLEGQEKAIDRARAWTADLAHGLKTPLAVLTADSERLRSAGNTEVADDLDQLAQTMKRRIDRELIRARVRSGATTKKACANVTKVISQVVGTLKRIPMGAELNWVVSSTEDLYVSMLPDDLTELIGNVLENASKWATQTVSITINKEEAITVLVEDDGPGVTEENLYSLGRRGVRLDEKIHGSGLGLAIAIDLVEAYQGSIRFHKSSIGGLGVEMRFQSPEETR